MRADEQWEMPCQHPDLPGGAVHVWRVDADSGMLDVPRYREMLSPDECARASRFRLAKHKARYIIGRGILRVLCGRYLRVEPSQLPFAYGTHGKPFLDVKCDGQGLHFNVSHAENILMYAFARDRSVGIDVERVHAEIDFMPIARRWFTPREAQTIASLPLSEQQNAFFRTWTRKEAYLKAVGDGLGSSLKTFEVSVCSPNIGGMIEHLDAPAAGLQWRFEDITAGHGWVAAIVSEGQDWDPALWQWI